MGGGYDGDEREIVRWIDHLEMDGGCCFTDFACMLVGPVCFGSCLYLFFALVKFCRTYVSCHIRGRN